VTLTHGSLFSGIGGFEAGFANVGIKTLWSVEIDPDCNAVRRLHWPEVKQYNDVREVGAHNLEKVDIISGGFPCQDLSVAGKRAGLSGERSGLFHEAIRVVSELRPRLLILENVPGLFSSNGGRDFACVLRELGKLRPVEISWRIYDSQYFSVAQRRRRVFIVCDFGGECAGEILALAEGLRGYPAPRREAGQ